MSRPRIPFSKVSCVGNEMVYLTEAIDSGWLTTAEKTQQFENEFMKAVGARYACAVNSCTAALHLALEALAVGPGDKVIAPSMTFTASAEIIRYLGADPVFVDVDYGTRMITPEIFREAITREGFIKALVVVHFGGQATPLLEDNGTGLLDLCEHHGVKVVEDAAHAFPCRHHNRMVGSLGDVTCFSFYANKTITTGEGGMLTTNAPNIAERVKLMRLHGINRDIWNRYTDTKPNWEYDVVAPGFKYNMPDINAAIGLAQLERAEQMRQERQRCAELYFERLSDIDCLDLPEVRCAFEDHAWHLFWVVFHTDAPVSRNTFIEKMAEAGIGTSVHYKPLHRMSYYRERYGLKPEDFPNSERIWHGTVSLPIYPSLSDDDLEYISDVIHKILMI